jgi:hypothetical protein
MILIFPPVSNINNKKVTFIGLKYKQILTIYTIFDDIIPNLPFNLNRL